MKSYRCYYTFVRWWYLSPTLLFWKYYQSGLLEDCLLYSVRW